MVQGANGVKTLPMDAITAAERQRKAFSAKPLKDLEDSIALRGLLHPIVVRRNGAENFLVCGERRLRAMRALHNSNILFNFDGTCVTPGEIPYIELTDLSDTEYMEAELEENLLREDLTWQERNAALYAIHNIRTERDENTPSRILQKNLLQRQLTLRKQKLHGHTRMQSIAPQ